jgi:hypothetical protein
MLKQIDKKDIKNQTSYLPINAPIRQRMWHIENKTNIIPGCAICQKPVNWKTTTPQSYRRYCSQKCARNAPDTIKKTKATNLEKYGVEWNISSTDSRDKRDDTLLDRYNTVNIQDIPGVKLQSKQTLFNNYGVQGVFALLNVQAQVNQTNLKKYGVKYPLCSPDIRNQVKQTNLKKYGVDNPLKHPVIREKIKQTNLKKYGVDNPLGSNVIREKIKQKNINDFTVSHVMQKHMIDILPLIESDEWLFDQYINQNKTATQIAHELNIGTTTICSYLHKAEIAIRVNTNYSFKCIQWLESVALSESVFIQHALNEGEYSIPSTRYKADGYCAETNTIYEFHGDCFHGNPSVFESHIKCNPFSELTAGELYQKTIEREEHIISLGYNLVVIWESDFNKISK